MSQEEEQEEGEEAPRVRRRSRRRGRMKGSLKRRKRSSRRWRRKEIWGERVYVCVRRADVVQEGRWNDIPCNRTLPSICKKTAQKTDGQAQDHGCKPVRLLHRTPSPFTPSAPLSSYFPDRKSVV